MTDPTLKDRALDSVEHIVREMGIYGLTLDAVAKSIGVSKGGLLYHFPTKDSLIDAVLARTADFWRTAVEEAISNSNEGSGRIAKVLIETFLVDPDKWEPQCKRSAAAMMVLMIQNPKLTNPVRTIYVELLQRLSNDGLPNGLGDCILAVIDGIWFQWVTGIAPVDKKRVDSMRAQLLSWLQSNSQSKPNVRRKTTAVKKASRIK